MTRRGLLALAASLGTVDLTAFRLRAESLRRKAKITDVRVMLIRNQRRLTPYIRIDTDQGVSGLSDYWVELIEYDGPIVADGRIRLSDRPGVGVELNESAVRSRLADGESWWGG